MSSKELLMGHIKTNHASIREGVGIPLNQFGHANITVDLFSVVQAEQ